MPTIKIYKAFEQEIEIEFPCYMRDRNYYYCIESEKSCVSVVIDTLTQKVEHYTYIPSIVFTICQTSTYEEFTTAYEAVQEKIKQAVNQQTL